jgi:hypothetical protein
VNVKVYCIEAKSICENGFPENGKDQNGKSVICRCWYPKIGCILTALEKSDLTASGETQEMRNLFGGMFGNRNLLTKPDDKNIVEDI